MSIPDSGTSKSGGVKTLAIRLDPDTHAQLSLIAQLRDSTITDEIRQAIDTHIAAVKANPDLASKADGVLEDIERDAAARRDAIATLFGSDTAAPNQPSGTGSGRQRGRKASTEKEGSSDT